MYHSLQNPDYAGSIPFQNYNVIDGTSDYSTGGGTGGSLLGGVLTQYTGTNSYQNGFLIGQELETFAQKSNLLLSGMNTLASNVFFEANIGIGACSTAAHCAGNGAANTYDAAVGPTVNYSMEFFANFDIIFVIENGIMTARF